MSTRDGTAALRSQMVDELRVLDDIRSDKVAAAFEMVPRHLFAPHEPPEAAYPPNTADWART